MLEKMKSTLWVDSKIKIAPPDYSKENYLATFTPQRHLTPEQIFWSSEIEKMTPKPISKLTVYPPNTPAKLVPRVLPTKSQVKINLYTLTQLFWNLIKHVKRELHHVVSQKGKGVSNKQRNVTLLEVEQNSVDKQWANIERKNLLIQNENPIANWLSNKVLYNVMNDGNTVSRFSEMHDAYTVE
ncbi:hypothetical protein Tco_0981878 [Tanacetum coccineum]